jgi:hypothetical protein
VAEALPRGFSEDEICWEILRHWGARHVIDRSIARRDQEEPGAEHSPEVTFDQCQEAFDFGYAVKFAEDALPPSSAG